MGATFSNDVEAGSVALWPYSASMSRGYDVQWRIHESLFGFCWAGTNPRRVSNQGRLSTPPVNTGRTSLGSIV